MPAATGCVMIEEEILYNLELRDRLELRYFSIPAYLGD
jgi:hypothetical protein